MRRQARQFVAGLRGFWAPLAMTVALGLSALVPLSPLIDAESLHRPGGMQLDRSISYVVLSPLCATYDALTLLSLWQHLVIIGSVLGAYAVWRVTRCHTRCNTRRDTQGNTRRGHSRGGRLWSETWRAAVCLATVVAVYGGGVLLPRPTARIALADPDLIAVDFHSHTNASWDGRRGFDAEANRRWHEAAGFNVAYISDHRSVAGARAAMRRNPARAGDGVTLLQGLEAGDEDEHVIALNVDTTRLFDRGGRWHDPHYDKALARELDAAMLILSVPGNVRTIPGFRSGHDDPFYAIELSDGSPKGIAQEQRDRAQILRLADVLNLAVLAGSDNHGWGRTAIAWSIFRIPGWRMMTATQLDAAIQHTIRVNRRLAGIVVQRRSPDPGTSWMLLAATPMTVVWTMLRTLEPAERLAWLAWGWALWAVVALPWPRRRRIPSHSIEAGSPSLA